MNMGSDIMETRRNDELPEDLPEGMCRDTDGTTYDIGSVTRYIRNVVRCVNERKESEKRSKETVEYAGARPY